MKHEKSAVQKKCFTRKVQHKKSATCKEYNTENDDMKKVQHGNNATWRMCSKKESNMKKVQHEKNGKSEIWKKKCSQE